QFGQRREGHPPQFGPQPLIDFPAPQPREQAIRAAPRGHQVDHLVALRFIHVGSRLHPVDACVCEANPLPISLRSMSPPPCKGKGQGGGSAWRISLRYPARMWTTVPSPKIMARTAMPLARTAMEERAARLRAVANGVVGRLPSDVSTSGTTTPSTTSPSQKLKARSPVNSRAVAPPCAVAVTKYSTATMAFTTSAPSVHVPSRAASAERSSPSSSGAKPT